MDTKKTLKIFPAVTLLSFLVVNMPLAFAFTPSYGGASVTAGSDITLSLTPAPGLMSRGNQIQVVDAPGSAGLVGGGIPCAPLGPLSYPLLGATGDLWELQDPGFVLLGNPIGYDVGPAADTFVTVTFGPSATSGTITAFGSAVIYSVTPPAGPGLPARTIIASGPTAVPPLVAGGSVLATLTNIGPGGAAPNTARVGPWGGGTCGFDGPPVAGTSAPYTSVGTFFIDAPPVGGMILPLNTIALLQAAVVTNSFSIFGILSLAAAGSFGLVYYTVKRKN